MYDWHTPTANDTQYCSMQTTSHIQLQLLQHIFIFLPLRISITNSSECTHALYCKINVSIGFAFRIETKQASLHTNLHIYEEIPITASENNFTFTFWGAFSLYFCHWKQLIIIEECLIQTCSNTNSYFIISIAKTRSLYYNLLTAAPFLLESETQGVYYLKTFCITWTFLADFKFAAVIIIFLEAHISWTPTARAF